MYTCIYNRFQQYKPSANLFLQMAAASTSGEPGRLTVIVVAQSTSIEDGQDLLDTGSRPWQALLLQNLLTKKRGCTVRGTVSCHIVSGSSNLILRLVS